MRTWMKVPGYAAAVLALGGCVLPLNINIEDDWDVRVRGSGHVVSVSRSVPAFDAVHAEGAMTVVVDRTGYEGVTITAEDNLLPYLRAEVHDGVLRLRSDPGVRLEPRREIVIQVESYEVVELSGSGAVRIEAEIGSVPELWVTLSGASELVAWGSAGRAYLTVSGASRVDALDLDVERCYVTVSGASEALVWVFDRLEADASGASHVRFRGDPVVVASTSGASTVTKY